MSEGQADAPMPPEGVNPDAILQLGFGFWGSKTLLSAIELGLFTELAKAGRLDGEALRERLGLHPRSATDFFDALVALGMLERENGRVLATRRRPTCSSTGPSRPTSAACSRCATTGSTRSGDR